MRKLALVVGTVVMFSSAAFAGEGKGKSTKMTQLTPEQRNKMADLHEKMAACLRSDRSLSDCHEEAMKSCQDTMGGTCPMMMGHAKHHDRGMQHDEAK